MNFLWSSFEQGCFMTKVMGTHKVNLVVVTAPYPNKDHNEFLCTIVFFNKTTCEIITIIIWAGMLYSKSYEDLLEYADGSRDTSTQIMTTRNL